MPARCFFFQVPSKILKNKQNKTKQKPTTYQPNWTPDLVLQIGYSERWNGTRFEKWIFCVYFSQFFSPVDSNQKTEHHSTYQWDSEDTSRKNLPNRGWSKRVSKQEIRWISLFFCMWDSDYRFIQLYLWKQLCRFLPWYEIVDFSKTRSLYFRQIPKNWWSIEMTRASTSIQDNMSP